MATPVVLNGVSYSIPAVGEGSWGTNVSSYLIALGSGVLSKAGGSFTLTADADFGANFGLKSIYFKSRGTVSTTGVLRLGNAESVGWRNAANSADILLKVNSSDILEFNGNPITTLALGAADTVLRMNAGGTATEYAKLTDANIAAAAAIAVNKIAALTASRAIVSDGSGFASAATTTATQIGYLASATGTTGTTSTNLVFSTSPTFITPILGVAAATTVNKVTITTPATGSTLTIADGKILTVSNTLTFTGTDTNSFAFPSGSSTVMTLASADTITGAKTFGDGKLILSGASSGASTLKAPAAASTYVHTLPAATTTLVGTDFAQVITAKDIDGGTASNTSRITVPKAATATLTALTRKQGTIVYDTTLNQIFSDDGSNLNPIGSGAGEKNYISTGSNNAAGWTASGAGITVATNTTAAQLPRGLTSKSGILITGVSGSTAYAYYRFTLDQADYNRKLKIKFDILPVSGYASSDFKVDMYSNTASDYSGTSTRIVTSSDASSIFAIPNLTGQIQTTVDMPGSTAPYMELRIGLNGSNTHAINISDVIVGPGIQPQGVVVSEWRSFTPTGTWSTNTTYTGRFRRVGDTMDVQVKIATAGAPTSATLTVNMPTGFTIDTTKVVNTDMETTNPQNVSLGNFTTVDYGNQTYQGFVAYIGSTSAVGLYIGNAASTYLVSSGVVTQAVPFTYGANDNLTIMFRVPIAEWSGSGTVNVVQNDVEYVYNTATADSADTTSFGYGSGGVVFGSYTAARAKRIRFQTPIQSTDTVIIEVQNTGSSTSTPWTTLSDSFVRAGISPYHVQNSVSYGMGLDNVSINSTDLDVTFGTYLYESGSTYGAAGAAWSTVATWRWRVKKIKGGQAVGFGNVTQSVSGLVKSAGQLLGTNTNDVAATGYVGELVTASGSGVSIAASATAYTIASITLTAGDWDVTGTIEFGGAATAGTRSIAGISATSASFSGTVNGYSQILTPATSTASSGVSVVIPRVRVLLSGSATYYLVGRMDYSAGTITGLGTIEARRVR